jgi:DNA-binding beta-propeller fold protein YncE
LCLAVPTAVHAQKILNTVSVGSAPEAVAINTLTNKVYVANFLGGNVTVVDGSTDTTTTVQTRAHPVAVAVNENTNKVYVACHGSFPAVGGAGGITVIDGDTGSTTTVADPGLPVAVAVNAATNRIYVAHWIGGNVTVIDGDTNSSTTVAVPQATGVTRSAIAVNPVTNKIYVANSDNSAGRTNAGNIIVIDGATNATTVVTDHNAYTPHSIAVNTRTNKIYVANEGLPGTNHGNVTVLDGVTNTAMTLTDPRGFAPYAVAVNQTTNKIFVADFNDAAEDLKGSITMIDGVTDSITNLVDPNAISPCALAVDATANKIYVANCGGANLPGSVTIVDGATNSVTALADPNAASPQAIAIDAGTNRIYVANTMSNNVTVINGSAPSGFTLTIVESGSGTGTVTSNPSGIECPGSCSAVFESGTTITLNSASGASSIFEGWSGGPCSGAGACMVTLDSDQSVQAAFTAEASSDFVLNAASASLTVTHGGHGSDVLTLAPENGDFSSAIQLSCSVSGPSPMVTCGLSPASVTLGSNSATSMLTITASGQLARIVRDTRSPQYAVLLPLQVLALLAFGLALKSKRRQRQLAWLAPVILLINLQAGCGNGGSSTPPAAPMNYAVKVTATSGTIQHSTVVVVTVP